MIYRKNIYAWEQILRIIAGAALAIYGFWGFGMTLLGLMLIAGGVMLAMTGMFGWCPMCYIGGRHIDTRN